MNDDIVDLSTLFGHKKIEAHSQEYLDSFINMAVFWDKNACSANLHLKDADFDARNIISKTSLHSFKSVYATEPFLAGNRYYFEV